MDKARSWAPEYWLLAWSALCIAASVAAWYGHIFHGAQASWMVFAWLMNVLAAGFAAVWIIRCGKRYGQFSRGWILFRAWCGLIFGWIAYLLIASNRNVAGGATFEPWVLVGCFVVMLLSWLMPVLIKLVRIRPRKQ